MGIKNWLLKSIPLKNLLKEWCDIRNLYILDEKDYNKEIKKLFEDLKIGVYPTSSFLSDYKNYKVILIAKKEKISDNLIQDYLQELKNLILSLGRNKEDFYFINIKKEYLEYWKEIGIYPLFFVVWKTEKPLLERILSGEDHILPFEKNEKYIYNALDDFYVKPNDSLDLKDAQYYDFKKIIQNKNLKDYIFKYFVRKVEDKYILLMLYMKNSDFRLDYLRNLIDFFVYADRPVLKMEEILRHDTNYSKSLILLELRFDGFWKGIFFNCQSLFYREMKKRIILLPDYSISKKYIRLSKFQKEDKLILLPSLKKIQITIKNTKFEDILKELQNSDFKKSLLIIYNNDIL